MASQKGPLKYLRKERYKLEPGFASMLTYLKTMNTTTEAGSSLTPSAGKDAQKGAQDLASRSMDQYYESQELIKRMKWKRVTWDDDADYAGFSRRVLDNDTMFKRIPAFSFMSVRLVKDPSSNELAALPAPEKTVEEGSLTNWVLRERDPKPVGVYPLRTVGRARGAFTVDWTAGEVKVLDTASAQEILTFLLTVAPRLQALQLKMGDQQTEITENVELVRVRVGAVVKFNELDTSFWDDPKRRTDTNYVNPSDMESFLRGMLKSAFLYRWFLKGQQIRVMPPGHPYNADLENKELQIPSNFADYNWLKAHDRFEGIEKTFNSFRRVWWFWFALSMLLIGDVEVL